MVVFGFNPFSNKPTKLSYYALKEASAWPMIEGIPTCCSTYSGVPQTVPQGWGMGGASPLGSSDWRRSARNICARKSPEIGGKRVNAQSLHYCTTPGVTYSKYTSETLQQYMSNQKEEVRHGALASLRLLASLFRFVQRSLRLVATYKVAGACGFSTHGTHMYMIVDRYATIPKSILVNMQSS